MTPLDRFRASVALGILERTDAIGFLRAMGMEHSADAVEDIMEIVRRMAEPDESGDDAKLKDASSREKEQTGGVVAAQYRET